MVCTYCTYVRDKHGLYKSLMNSSQSSMYFSLSKIKKYTSTLCRLKINHERDVLVHMLCVNSWTISMDVNSNCPCFNTSWFILQVELGADIAGNNQVGSTELITLWCLYVLMLICHRCPPHIVLRRTDNGWAFVYCEPAITVVGFVNSKFN